MNLWKSSNIYIRYLNVQQTNRDFKYSCQTLVFEERRFSTVIAS